MIFDIVLLPPAADRAAFSPQRDRDLLELVVRLLHADLHARFHDRVADLSGVALHEHRQACATVDVLERRRVERSLLVAPREADGGNAFEDLRGDGPLVRNDLPERPVERHLEPLVRHHHVAPSPAFAKVHLGARDLAPLSAPPLRDELRLGRRAIDQVPRRVELPRDQDLRLRGERDSRPPATRHCFHLPPPSPCAPSPGAPSPPLRAGRSARTTCARSSGPSRGWVQSYERTWSERS